MKVDTSSIEWALRKLYREGVPDYIPDEQVAKYTAIIRQRNCDDRKKKKQNNVAHE